MASLLRGGHLIIRDEDELEDKEDTNNDGLGVMETKTCVDIFLFHEVAKHSQ